MFPKNSNGETQIAQFLHPFAVFRLPYIGSNQPITVSIIVCCHLGKN